MGEVEQTLERLNKVLVEAGFSEAEMSVLRKGRDRWYTSLELPLHFDNDGKYIAPEGKVYKPTIISWVELSDNSDTSGTIQ